MRTLVFVCVLCSLMACSGVEEEFDRRSSPDDNAILIVTVAEPGLPHGKHGIFVYVQLENEEPIQVAATKMENDGVPFTKKNIGLKWTSASNALVCLRPTDLPDRAVRVSISGPPSAEIRTGC